MHTIIQRKPFEVAYRHEIILITPSSFIERKIPQEQFLKVWQLAKTFPADQQFVRQNYHTITLNGSYILALMKKYLDDEKIQ